MPRARLDKALDLSNPKDSRSYIWAIGCCGGPLLLVLFPMLSPHMSNSSSDFRPFPPTVYKIHTLSTGIQFGALWVKDIGSVTLLQVMCLFLGLASSGMCPKRLELLCL